MNPSTLSEDGLKDLNKKPETYEDGDDSESDEKPSRRSGRRKIKIEYIEDKNRRHITFSKRKAGIMKKAYELSTLTGTQVLLLVVSETGLVYTFTTVKLQPIVTKPEGKNLIQACLNAPDPVPGEQVTGDVLSPREEKVDKKQPPQESPYGGNNGGYMPSPYPPSTYPPGNGYNHPAPHHHSYMPPPQPTHQGGYPAMYNSQYAPPHHHSQHSPAYGWQSNASNSTSIPAIRPEDDKGRREIVKK